MSTIMRENLIKALEQSFSKDEYSLHWDVDSKGLVEGWCRFQTTESIAQAATVMKEIEARLVTVTAHKIEKEKKHEIVYHFDLDGSACSICIPVAFEKNEVPSITPILKTADWTERELQELYDIQVLNHPNPKRLFLEDTIDEGIMNSMISLSEAMQGASSQTLWEKVIASNLEEKK